MARTSSLRLALLLLLATGSVSCWNPFRRSRPTPPPAPAPTPAEVRAPAPETPPKPSPLPAPPKVEQADVYSQPPAPVEAEQPAIPPPVPSRTRKRPQASQPPAAEPPPPEPVEIPRLTQLMSPEEEREYNRSIDESLQRARSNVEAIRDRRLNDEQTAVLNRVRTFLSQTEEVRKADLVTARSLAQRADLLAQDLVQSLR